jgi:hypothetical protein
MFIFTLDHTYQIPINSIVDWCNSIYGPNSPNTWQQNQFTFSFFNFDDALLFANNWL